MEQTSGTAAPEKPRLAVTPVPGGLLDDLRARHYAARAALTEAKEREEDLRRQILDTLTQAHPEIGKFDLAGTPHYPAMTLAWVDTVRLNAKRLKDEKPLLYVEYAEFGGHWELRPARGL